MLVVDRAPDVVGLVFIVQILRDLRHKLPHFRNRPFLVVNDLVKIQRLRLRHALVEEHHLDVFQHFQRCVARAAEGNAVDGDVVVPAAVVPILVQINLGQGLQVDERTLLLKSPPEVPTHQVDVPCRTGIQFGGKRLAAVRVAQSHQLELDAVLILDPRVAAEGIVFHGVLRVSVVAIEVVVAVSPHRKGEVCRHTILGVVDVRLGVFLGGRRLGRLVGLFVCPRRSRRGVFFAAGRQNRQNQQQRQQYA